MEGMSNHLLYCVLLRKHFQFRDDKMDSRGAGGPDSEIFRMRIIRNIRETFVVNENEVFYWSWSVGSQPLSGAALNLSPLARPPLWIYYFHGFLSREKRCYAESRKGGISVQKEDL